MIAMLRNPNSGFMIAADQVVAITAVQNPDNSYSYQIFTTTSTYQSPAYQSTATFPDPVSAEQAAYNIFVIELT
jgi:hypothetical protein